MSAVLDTHAAIWYFQRSKKLSSVALQSIRRAVEEGKPVYVSAISFVETIYLVERGRLPLEALHRLEAGLKHTASGLLVQPVDEDVAQAVHKVPRDVVPDMPDRIIAATALHLGLPLITIIDTGESNRQESRRSGSLLPREGGASGVDALELPRCDRARERIQSRAWLNSVESSRCRDRSQLNCSTRWSAPAPPDRGLPRSSRPRPW